MTYTMHNVDAYNSMYIYIYIYTCIYIYIYIHSCIDVLHIPCLRCSSAVVWRNDCNHMAKLEIHRTHDSAFPHGKYKHLHQEFTKLARD